MELKYYDEVEFSTVLRTIDPDGFKEPIKSVINKNRVSGKGRVMSVLGEKVGLKITEASIRCTTLVEEEHECPVCMEDHYGEIEKEIDEVIPDLSGETIIVEKGEIVICKEKAV